MYLYPNTRQTSNYTTPIEREKNQQINIAVDPDTDDGDVYMLTTDPLRKEATQMFKHTQMGTTITPSTFTAKTPVYSQTQN